LRVGLVPRFEDFVLNAGGLFIWVFIVSEYLRMSTDPDEELHTLLSRQSLSSMSAEAKMDELYLTIFQGCNWNDQGFVKGYGLIMGAIMAAKTPLSMSALQSLHRHTLSPQVKVRKYLRPLTPLLANLDNERTPVNILHLSLKDFVTVRAQSSVNGRKCSACAVFTYHPLGRRSPRSVFNAFAVR